MWLVSVSIAALAAIFEVLAIAASGGAARAGLDVYTVVFFILAPVYATVGAVIVWRAAGNRVGWVIASIGLLLAIENCAGSLVSYALTPAGRWLPGTIWIDWLSNWIWVPAVVGALALLPIFFPDGRVPSRRWRPLVWLVCGSAAISALGFVVSPDPITVSSSTATFVNPTGIAALGPASSLFHALYVIAILVGVLGGAASLVVRYRRGSPDERHQVKWFAGAFVLVAALLAAYAGGQYLLKVVFPDWVIGVIVCLALSAVPLAVAVAVLKYRLYDIDVVLSRALVYALLAGFITAVYVAIVVGVGTLIGSGNKPNLVLSILATAVVAVGFQPVRERVQKVANRLVYGVRATPYEVLAQFSEHVAETYAGDEVLSRMARVLAEGTGASRAEVWLRSGAYITAAATYPQSEAADEPVPVQGQLMPEIRGADHAVPVLHQGELLGALAVTKRQGESLTPIEEKLLGDLALQAGLVLKNVGLTSDLLQRLDELRLSRQRLVAAQDAERRRLERDLHDGAQQNLVALKVKLNLAEMYAGKDPAKARALMTELTADADEALETLRDLARGIYPPLLADRGLAAALQSQGRKAPMPVEVDADGIGRYPQETEAAVYFCCLEALQNVAKYADGATAHVRLSHDGGSLVFSVTDNGRGFDSEATAKGSGLQNMSDRLAALGGELAVWSSPAEGTRISGTLPVPLLRPA
jgi:signal transduction histidine kinase